MVAMEMLRIRPSFGNFALVDGCAVIPAHKFVRRQQQLSDTSRNSIKHHGWSS